MANEIATKLGLPFVELDALHWAAGWRVLSQDDPNEFVRRVSRRDFGLMYAESEGLKGLVLARRAELKKAA